ncbi:MAG: TetR/AcrR family transcriptional regulator [Gemmatimonadota bacterium]|nr:MAG: TetR/AcrR family transcriptional regulator [Gemmatimonadota bacterium]
MAIPRGQAHDTILQAAVELVKERGASAITVDAVAKAAGSAKGLVHYHFKTKLGLLGAVTERIAQARERNWIAALEPGVAQSAVERSWDLLTSESTSGVTLAWQSLLQSGDALTDHSVKSLAARFSRTLGDAFVQYLEVEMELEPTVPNEEVGWLMTAVIDGVGLQMLAGAKADELQGAFAAAWLGLLSLTEPRTV